MSTLQLLMLGIILQGCIVVPLFDCQDVIKFETMSPDGKYIATLFVRNCGATTSFSTSVNLRSKSEKFSGDEGRILIIKGRPQIKIAWDDNMKLHFECDECEKNNIFKQETSWKDITISYRFSQ
jgi:hypothetical protein